MISRQIIFTFFLFATLKGLCNTEVNLGFFGDTKSEEYQGVELGLQEAKHQGNFSDIKYNFFINPDDSKISEINSLNVVITDFRQKKLDMLLEKFETLPVFNLSDDSDSLRKKCFINGFHIPPSTSMLNDAAKLATRVGKVRAWHHNFRKYAALQLNNRFFKYYKEVMSEKAWFGWVSVKIIAEVSLRTRNPEQLIVNLKGNLKFDGQKGRKLSFRANGQLRQPIFVIQNNNVVEEIPNFVNERYGGLDLIGGTECIKIN